MRLSRAGLRYQTQRTVTQGDPFDRSQEESDWHVEDTHTGLRAGPYDRAQAQEHAEALNDIEAEKRYLLGYTARGSEKSRRSA